MTDSARRAPSIREPRAWAIVALGFVVIATVVATWLAIDRRPPEWDHANHLERAVACAGDMARGDVRTLIERSSFYPPVVPCLAGLVYRFWPSDAAAAQSVILLFLALGMAATYALGRDLAGGAAGVASALLFATAPFVVFSSLRFQLDLPLAAVVAVAIVTLRRTEGFTRFGWSLVTGIVCGVGMLTKPPFAVYVALPILLVLWRVRDRRAWLNVGVAAVLAGALSVPWYGPRLMGLPMQIGNRSFKQAAESGHAEALTWGGLSFYPEWFVNQFGAIAVVLCCVGLILAMRRRQIFPVLVLVVPLALFSLLQNKNLRYTLPLLPMAAAFAGAAHAALRGRWRTLVTGVLAIACVVQVTGTAFGVPRSFILPGLGMPWVLDSSPMRTDWRQREILALIARRGGAAERTVSVVPNHIFFSVSNFRYYAVRDKSRLRFQRAWDGEPLAIEYMILKSGDVGPSWTADRPRRIADRLADDPYLARVFPVIGEFPLPDGALATVRERSIAPIANARPEAVGNAVAASIRRQLGDYARDVEGLRVALEYDDAILGGRVRRVEIVAAAATVGELQRRNAGTLAVRDIKLVVDDLLVNPYSAQGAERFDPLDAGRVRIESATILGRDLQAFLHTQKDFRRASIRLEQNALVFGMAQPGPDVSARVRFLPAVGQPFALAADDVRLGGIRVPQALVNWIVRNYDPAPRLASRLPVPVEVGRIAISADAIRISDGSASRGPFDGRGESPSNAKGR